MPNKINLPAQFDLNTLDGKNGFVIEGVTSGSLFGYSVVSDGDINGDNFADIVIGNFISSDQSDDPNTAITAYVVYGKTRFDPTIYINTLSPSDGFAIPQTSYNDYEGKSIDIAGDFNGDGFADIVIGASQGLYNTDIYGSGKAYIVFGGINIDSVNLENCMAPPLCTKEFKSCCIEITGDVDETCCIISNSCKKMADPILKVFSGIRC